MLVPMPPPNLYVVAGPNGAGKSTFAKLFLPDYADCREYVNADLIAAGMSPFNPEGQAIQAGRLMLDRIEALARQRADFGFETTLAGRGWLPLLERLRDQGYRLTMFFLWLPSPDLAVVGWRRGSVQADIQSPNRSFADDSHVGSRTSSRSTCRS
jgi:predicted ABC-type ATPase